MSNTGGGGSVARRPASRSTNTAAIAHVSPSTSNAVSQTTVRTYRLVRPGVARRGERAQRANSPASERPRDGYPGPQRARETLRLDGHVDGAAVTGEARLRAVELRVAEGEDAAVAAEQPIAVAGLRGAQLHRPRDDAQAGAGQAAVVARLAERE